MSLLNNNKNAGKKGGKSAKANNANAKGVIKQAKTVNVKNKLRTGGTRGS